MRSIMMYEKYSHIFKYIQKMMQLTGSAGKELHQPRISIHELSSAARWAVPGVFCGAKELLCPKHHPQPQHFGSASPPEKSTKERCQPHSTPLFCKFTHVVLVMSSWSAATLVVQPPTSSICGNYSEHEPKK